MTNKHGEKDLDFSWLKSKKVIRTFKIVKWQKAPAIYWPAETKFPPVVPPQLMF